MESVNSNDLNYMGGVNYSFSIQLAPGVYDYFFNITDGKYNTSFPISQLTVVASPENGGGDGNGDPGGPEGDNPLGIIIITGVVIGSAIVGVILYRFKSSKDSVSSFNKKIEN